MTKTKRVFMGVGLLLVGGLVTTHMNNWTSGWNVNLAFGISLLAPSIGLSGLLLIWQGIKQIKQNH